MAFFLYSCSGLSSSLSLEEAGEEVFPAAAAGLHGSTVTISSLPAEEEDLSISELAGERGCWAAGSPSAADGGGEWESIDTRTSPSSLYSAFEKTIPAVGVSLESRCSR